MPIVTADRVIFNNYLDTVDEAMTTAYNCMAGVICGYGKLTREQDRKIRLAYDELFRASNSLRDIRKFASKIKFNDEIDKRKESEESR